MEIGEKETEILNILQDDGKISLENLSDMVDLDKDEVKEMVEGLENNGYIKKYKAVINWEKLEKEPAYASINIKVELSREGGYDKIAERIAGFPEVENIRLISGEYDLRIVVKGGSMRDIADFIAEKISPLENVRDTVTHFVLKTYKKDGEKLFEQAEDRRIQISP
ncbi:Lrp/AsnC family transcriptional regulator [archaeon SCG-AAA382B04]|nr:Lrp/AsnC family transcriptional regulator [archaeon SCG-AAA382B04]